VPGWQCLRALLVQANLKAAPWQWRFDAPVETRAKALLLPELPEVGAAASCRGEGAPPAGRRRAAPCRDVAAAGRRVNRAQRVRERQSGPCSVMLLSREVMPNDADCSLSGQVDMRVLRTHCGPLSNKRSRGRKHARAERRKSDLPTADNTPLRVVGFTLNLPRVNEAGRPPLLSLGALHGALAARGGGALIVHVRRNVVKTTVSRLLKSAAAESSRCETVNGQVSDKCDVEAVELVPRWGVTDNDRRRKRADKHVARGGEFNRYIVRFVYLETILVDLFDNASFRENAVSFATTLRRCVTRAIQPQFAGSVWRARAIGGPPRFLPLHSRPRSSKRQEYGTAVMERRGPPLRSSTLLPGRPPSGRVVLSCCFCFFLSPTAIAMVAPSGDSRV